MVCMDYLAVPFDVEGFIYCLGAIPVGLTAPEIDEKTVAVHALHDVGLDFGIIVICATI